MSIIRNYNSKISGKRINNVVWKADIIGNNIPMRKKVAMIDKQRVNLVSIGDGKEPLMGEESPDSVLDVSHLKGVFSDDDDLTASIRDGRLYLTNGKDTFWFCLLDEHIQEPNYPSNMKLDTEFRTDPKKFAKMYSKDVKDGYAKLVADRDGNGKQYVRAFLYDKNGILKDSVILADSWEGTESVSRYPIDYLRNMDKMKGSVSIRMSTDYPLVANTLNDEVQTEYLLAPRIGRYDDEEPFAYESKQERNWVASHNRKARRDRAPRKRLVSVRRR